MGLVSDIVKEGKRMGGDISKAGKRAGGDIMDFLDENPLAFLPYTATKYAIDAYQNYLTTPEVPGVPKAPGDVTPLVDQRKRKGPVDVIFAGRNYHWTGTVQPTLRDKGGE